MKPSAYKGNDPYIFVSYSHKDGDVLKILADMEANHFRFWYDQGIETGRDWADVIAQRVKNCCQFLVFLSRHAVESENVKDEIHLAVKYHQNILVVYLDETKLSGGLELQLDRKQALRRSNYKSTTGFFREILNSLDDKTRKQFHSTAQTSFETRYALREVISDGAFNTAYLGWSNALSIPVFVKHYTNLHARSGKFSHRIAFNEIRFHKALSGCPFVPTLLDFFADDNNIYIVQSYIAGQSLKTLISETAFDSPRDRERWCVDIALQTARVLRYLHGADRPLIHRDIKPANLLFTSQGDVCLVDLNCCMELTPDSGEEELILATPGYAPPEQYLPGKADRRTDLFALGATMVHILTGTPPREHAVGWNLIRLHCGDYDPFLEEIIFKMTCAAKEDRYETVEEVIAALETCSGHGAAVRAGMLAKSNRRLKSVQRELRQHAEAGRCHPRSPGTAGIQPTALPTGQTCFDAVTVGQSDWSTTIAPVQTGLLSSTVFHDNP